MSVAVVGKEKKDSLDTVMKGFQIYSAMGGGKEEKATTSPMTRRMQKMEMEPNDQYSSPNRMTGMGKTRPV